jgi:hypothetical protein
MMQAPEIQARATESGFSAGANAAGSEVQSQQVGHQQQTDRHFRPYEEATRGLGAAATGVSDMETAQMLTGNRYQTSDVHSKTEIKRLTDENTVLNYALKMAQGAEEKLKAGSSQKAAMQQPAQVAGMRKPQPEVIDLDAAPPVTPSARGAADAAIRQGQAETRLPMPQPAYDSDAYWLQQYGDLPQDLVLPPDAEDLVAGAADGAVRAATRQKATTRQKRVLSKGKK